MQLLSDPLEITQEMFVGFSEDANHHIGGEVDEKYSLSLAAYAILAAIFFVLFGMIEVINHWNTWTSKAFLSSLGFLGLTSTMSVTLWFVSFHKHLSKEPLYFVDLIFHLFAGALLGGLAAFAMDSVQAVYFTGVGILVFARCMYVQSDWKMTTLSSLMAWGSSSLAFFMFSPSKVVYQSEFLTRFVSIQVLLFISLFIAIFGSYRVGRLIRREIQARSLGRYNIDQSLGEGGFGVVYKAYDNFLRRPCAIKILHQQASQDDELVERFETEVRTTSLLLSPHTVRVYDFGVSSHQRMFYVMELLQGRDLESIVLNKGVLSIRRALRLAGQCAAALTEAHEHNIIHRDIKPSNLFIVGEEPDEQLKVLDFGLAFLADKGNSDELDEKVLCTAAYVPPERAVGEKGDFRSDIYMLGAVLYFLLTGEAVFPDGSTQALLKQHAMITPNPPSELRRGIPKDVDALVMRCLEKEPENRFRSMRVLRRALLRAERAVAHSMTSSSLIERSS